MSQPNTEFLDEICCDFEDRWQFGLPMDVIRKFLTDQVPEHSAIYPTLACEVAQIDIEHRWRHLVKLAERQSAQELAALALEIERVPTSRDYLQLLPPQFAEIDEFRRSVVDTELKVRCKYGDAPLPSTFGMPFDLWEKYEKYMPRLSIWQGDTWAWEAPICSPLSIGRQAVDEPLPPKVLHCDKQSRFICCPLVDKTISRQQIVVRAIVGKWIEVVNSSKNRDFTVLHQAVLTPGDTAAITLPCIINLDAVKIRISRPMLESR